MYFAYCRVMHNARYVQWYLNTLKKKKRNKASKNLHVHAPQKKVMSLGPYKELSDENYDLWLTLPLTEIRDDQVKLHLVVNRLVKKCLNISNCFWE